MISFIFPDGFLWGTATSSFQVEGAAYADGKGPSIWDKACDDFPGRFSKGANPSVAAGFYHHYKEDIRSMKELGLKSFRLSISWTRLFPNGRGAVNQRGIDFYNSVIDCLLEHGIEPFVDLYHWDLPSALQDEGGFENRALLADFQNYARTCFRAFGDRVKLWSTFNEPSVIALSSYASKGFPPYKGELSSGLLAAQHLLLMHYQTVGLYREMGLGGKIGAVNAFVPVYPNTLASEDVLAAVRQQDIICNWWLRPMFMGEYPSSILQENDYYAAMPSGFEEELRREFVEMDFAGLNYYCPARTAYCPDSPLRSKPVEVFYAQTDYGFRVYPSGLSDSLRYVSSEYNNPEIYVTENGIGNARFDELGAEIEDDNRIEYLQEHLRALSRSIEAGSNVRGYYYWSHFDDFTGERGYDINFGLLHVDRETLKRTPRKSWHYYRECIANNGIS